MQYIFFGTPEFAKIVLAGLIENNLLPEVVVCNPDRPIGRDQVVTPPPTKKLAKKHNALIYQPEKLGLEGWKSEIENIKPEVGVLAAYGKIIPKEIIDYFPKGIIGIHPSLLPKYRGPTPIRSAMLAGEEQVGVTLFLMDEKVDHGPILAKQELEILNSNYETLKQRLAKLGVEMVVEHLPKYLQGEAKPRPQNHSNATFTSFFKTEDAKVDYSDFVGAVEGRASEKAKKIYKMILALNPEPGVWTHTDENQILGLPKNKRVKLLEADLKEGKLIPKKVHVAGKTPRSI